MQIGNSAGKILFKKDEVIIQVLTPFEENYRINKETIEIHDVFLDQKQTIEISIQWLRLVSCAGMRVIEGMCKHMEHKA